MKRLGLMAAMVALAAGGAFAQQQQQKTTRASTDTAGIAKVRTAYQKAAAAQDPAAIAKLFATDGEEMPPDAPAVKGRTAIENYHKQFAQQFMVHGVTITPTETHVSGNIGYDVGSVKQTLMAQKSGAMFDVTSKYIVLLKKDASGAWLITHLIYNDDKAMPGAGAKK